MTTNFFLGWRRKTGFVTLVLTCVLMAGWMRSRNHVEWVQIDTPFLNCLFLSGEQRLLCTCGKERNGNMGISNGKVSIGRFPVHSFTGKSIHIEWESFAATQVEMTPLFQASPRPRDRFVLNWLIGDGERKRAMIPYWSIILPLTLLSAWLVLGKSQKSPTR